MGEVRQDARIRDVRAISVTERATIQGPLVQLFLMRVMGA
jgi:hypothetical protein